MDELLEKYIDYFESFHNRPITPPELDEAKRSLEKLSGGDLKKAEALLNQTIEKKWAKIYRLQKSDNQEKKKADFIERNYKDDDLKRFEMAAYKRWQRELKEYREKEAEELKAKGIVIDYSDRTLEGVKARWKLKRSLVKN